MDAQLSPNAIEAEAMQHAKEIKKQSDDACDMNRAAIEMRTRLQAALASLIPLRGGVNLIQMRMMLANQCINQSL